MKAYLVVCQEEDEDEMMRSAVSEHGGDEQEIQVVRVEKLEVAGTGAGSEVGAAASSRSSSSSSSTSDQEAAEGSTQIVKKEGKKKRRKKKKVSFNFIQIYRMARLHALELYNQIQSH